MNEAKENMNLKFAGKDSCEYIVKKRNLNPKQCMQCKKGSAIVYLNFDGVTVQDCYIVSTFVSISR